MKNKLIYVSTYLIIGVCVTAADWTDDIHLPCFFCSDNTSIQMKYNDARDECTTLAEMKAGAPASQATQAGRNTKTRLVTLFSECMQGKGWDVPGPSTQSATDVDGNRIAVSGPMGTFGAGLGGAISPTYSSPQPGFAPPPSFAASANVPPPTPITTQSVNTPRTYVPQPIDESHKRRSAECAFARANRDVSVVSKKRAKACDLECSEMLRSAPEAPRPAACRPQ